MPSVGPKPAKTETWGEQLVRLRMMADPDDLEYSVDLSHHDRAAIRDLLREFESGPTVEKQSIMLRFAEAALSGMLTECAGGRQPPSDWIHQQCYEHALAMTQLFDEYAAQLGKGK